MTKPERALARQEATMARIQLESGNIRSAQNHLTLLLKLLDDTPKPRREAALNAAHEARKLRKALWEFQEQQNRGRK